MRFTRVYHVHLDLPKEGIAFQATILNWMDFIALGFRHKLDFILNNAFQAGVEVILDSWY